ncbi:cleavage and polyadenylation specificity factor subunit 1 [Cucumis melo var. makuwa]|uniref:Cleavage and polyadenylation specificity factor subunit 1 n=1 Tax=Cucumis melo var. makuwa TaxID=1194695 RepID=A0A5D3D541_CUCMM|nr:cleavage and polyadenylation specificity factor subunit 1 [Cucumis melo var. makuwa]
MPPKVVPSYGGWIKVRGIPLHAWNLESFIQIQDACGGYIDVVRETRDLTDLIEAIIRIKDNYSGFILAFVKLLDKKGKVL